ncbi:MarR family transcriptional regulator [Agaricicola taiwanensis]|uniref:MarR family transcriptional regulator n=1 Tax=Agaricicola taiwanensis TaxID=591372 RepID=A0A8J2YEU8_9RHOB|nr:MarR family transcriptional regulator [Agaricicola taiwanensis]GGE38905.1 MarR family transcriptional regulator [Agaricicola taiwanensis]
MSTSSTRMAFIDELVKVNRQIRTLFNARAKSFGLTHSRARLILHLAKNGEATQTQLADAMDVEQPTMVRLIDGLEKIGLLERQVMENDRRSKRVVLTEAASTQADGVLSFSNQLRNEILEEIDEEDLLAAIRVLRAVSGKIGDVS